MYIKKVLALAIFLVWALAAINLSTPAPVSACLTFPIVGAAAPTMLDGPPPPPADYRCCDPGNCCTCEPSYLGRACSYCGSHPDAWYEGEVRYECDCAWGYWVIAEWASCGFC
jgi:hypothetical protein